VRVEVCGAVFSISCHNTLDLVVFDLCGNEDTATAKALGISPGPLLRQAEVGQREPLIAVLW
jgi:hypothetical protein